MPIEHISDTARWVAVYRAMETERPDAIFRDPFARRLAGARGEEIVEGIKRGRSIAWSMIVRTALFDEILMRVLGEAKVELVLNLAAGLDARPWRLDLPESLRWVDADLPGILDYKLDALRDETPRCDYEGVRIDLREREPRRELFARLAENSRSTLVLTEGLLLYLEPESVGELASDLAAEKGFHSWIIDLANPRLLKMMLRWMGKTTSAGGAEFRFAPAEGTGFFARFGWREAEYRSMWDESQRLKREMRGAWLWRFLSRFSSQRRREEARRMSGVVLLQREGEVG